MAKFDLFNSAVYKKWHFQKNFTLTFVVLTVICISLGVVSIAMLFLENNFLIGLGQITLGLVLLLESYALAARFSTAKLSSDNLADRLSESALELFSRVYHVAIREGIIDIIPEYLFEKFTLIDRGKIVFNRLGLPFSKTLDVKSKATNPKFSDQITNLLGFLANSHKTITVEDLMDSIVTYSEKIQAYLKTLKFSTNDFLAVTRWERGLFESRPTKFWEKSAVLAGIGEDWAFGYTPILSSYSTDLSRYFQDTNIQINIYSHDNILGEMQAILAKPDQNNCLLVGEPGVGKKTIVNALAAKLSKGDCLPSLKYKRIRQLDIGTLIAGGNKNELVARINNAFVEAINAGNIILYIDNFQSLLGSANGGEEVGGIDATQIILPFIQNRGLRIIASITSDDYFSRVRANPSIAEAFGKIDVLPATVDDTMAIMLGETSFIERHYNVYIPFDTIKKITSLSDRYIHDVPFPEKSLQLMEEIAAKVGGHGKLELIFPETAEEFISKKANVPIGQAQEGEKEKLLDLENLLHSRVVGQEEAISTVSDALRRVRAGLTTGKRPAGVFLFLGPTGVGKTETAKALAESYFGSEKQMIRLDMSEYQQPNSIDRLLGSQSSPSGVLTDAILANPFSLILMDEIEKADKNILNVFLQVFEDGRLTDVRGRVSDFTNSIIIATSNAGSQFIRENAGKLPPEQMKTNLLNLIQQEGTFTPEFLNRFDSVIVYRPLTKSELMKVAQFMIADMNKNLAEKQIGVSVSPEALAKLAELGYDPQFGARPMRRVITQKIENLLAKKMLEGSVQEGQILNIGVDDLI